MPEERRSGPTRRSDPPPLTRADLPTDLTPETIRGLPMSTLRRLGRPGNGILDAEEQKVFSEALHDVMTETAGRVSRQIGRSDWAEMRRDAAARRGRSSGAGRPAWLDDQLQRISERIEQQVGAAESLAPAVDWSFAQSDAKPEAQSEAQPKAEPEAQPEQDDPAPSTTTADHHDADDGTVSDLEDRLSEQVELVQVMSEIAEVSKRTYDLEQQRDLQNTRTVFFGFVVSVAVLVAGWAPIVAADDWSERLWVLGLTVATCVLAGVVYALIRANQNRRLAKSED